MPRSDAKGIFWTDITPKEEKKNVLLIAEGWIEFTPGYWIEKHIHKDEELESLDFLYGTEEAYAQARKDLNKKCEPPEPVWLADDYLPDIEEAKAFQVDLFTDTELLAAAREGDYGHKRRLIFDVECYRNYFLVAFKCLTTNKVTFFERSEFASFNGDKLRWMFDNFHVIGFNSNNYDIPICTLAVADCTTEQMKEATDMIIVYRMRGYEVLKEFRVKSFKYDTTDLVEVAPLFASLKIYAGRMHSRRMQDLPFAPDKDLTYEQMDLTRWYCVNDLDNTIDLYNNNIEALKLRSVMSGEYKLNLISKSDAQIAEAVISKGIEGMTGRRAVRPEAIPFTEHRYHVPSFIEYTSFHMKEVLRYIAEAKFYTNEHGKITFPETLKVLNVQIANTAYTIGIGGLHSKEKASCHFATDRTILIDRDVTSYYPAIIMNQNLHPRHLGNNFNYVYGQIVERRLTAKREGNKAVADSLKITINGSFGKFGNKYSLLYSPDLLIQTTITGQLSLLMLIERLEIAGIPVVSANTDGVVIKCPIDKQTEMEEIVIGWETDTDFNTEDTEYKALYSKDVNNYIAVKANTDATMDLWSRIKTKGVFAKPGLSKNPQSFICVEAVIRYLLDQVPLQHTLTTCTDIRKFITVRTVKGGAVKLYEEGMPGTYLGKAIRWYYAKGDKGEIVYANSGKKVPLSDGAEPLMLLPDALPANIDFDRYEKECRKLLKMLGCD